MAVSIGLAVVVGFFAVRAHARAQWGSAPTRTLVRLAAASSTNGLPAAPDVEIVMYQGYATVGGAKIRLSQLWGKGKPVVLNYFAGLCPPAGAMNLGETTILVVDDDDKLISLLELYLKREGFRVIAARDGVQALDPFDRHRPNFIILDLMLPRIDGISVCQRIRETSRVPILMLSAKAEETDKVVGLQAGADDYVSKPFSPQELVARVRTILRRTRCPTGRLTRGSLVIDLDRHEVFVEGREVRLTAIEFKLLRTLMESPGRVFTRDRLLTTFHAFDEPVVDRAIDVHIGRLREKLGDDPSTPRFIQTVRGFGYKLLESGRAG